MIAVYKFTKNQQIVFSTAIVSKMKKYICLEKLKQEQ